ncbi:hypothetical protein R3P38DRAFT_160326 [Favolaschia claudopus]|uniref:Uncharacterized protein n=1 Tax=Favolaschia claudopus TaxID=2862362 RepID=A0AAW0CVP9_9AGAR
MQRQRVRRGSEHAQGVRGEGQCGCPGAQQRAATVWGGAGGCEIDQARRSLFGRRGYGGGWGDVEVDSNNRCIAFFRRYKTGIRDCHTSAATHQVHALPPSGWHTTSPTPSLLRPPGIPAKSLSSSPSSEFQRQGHPDTRLIKIRGPCSPCSFPCSSSSVATLHLVPGWSSSPPAACAKRVIPPRVQLDSHVTDNPFAHRVHPSLGVAIHGEGCLSFHCC